HCYNKKKIFAKPLKFLFEFEPELKNKTSIEQMIMIDDREDNFKFNPKNGIVIKEYAPDPSNVENLRADDTELLKIMEQLENDIIYN
ncbi:unnamed protein product, partial [marine sediment metagenome]